MKLSFIFLIALAIFRIHMITLGKQKKAKKIVDMDEKKHRETKIISSL